MLAASSSLPADAVHGAPRRFPRVVGGARTEGALVGDDPGVPAHFLRPLCVPEEVGIVALLPDENEMRGGHEVGDESATRSGARKGIRPDAEPPAVVAALVLTPELLVGLGRDVGADQRPP